MQVYGSRNGLYPDEKRSMSSMFKKNNPGRAVVTDFGYRKHSAVT